MSPKLTSEVTLSKDEIHIPLKALWQPNGPAHRNSVPQVKRTSRSSRFGCA